LVVFGINSSSFTRVGNLVIGATLTHLFGPLTVPLPPFPSPPCPSYYGCPYIGTYDPPLKTGPLFLFKHSFCSLTGYRSDPERAPPPELCALICLPASGVPLCTDPLNPPHIMVSETHPFHYSTKRPSRLFSFLIPCLFL